MLVSYNCAIRCLLGIHPHKCKCVFDHQKKHYSCSVI